MNALTDAERQRALDGVGHACGVDRGDVVDEGDLVVGQWTIEHEGDLLGAVGAGVNIDAFQRDATLVWS